jgi:hypothetical protein
MRRLPTIPPSPTHQHITVRLPISQPIYALARWTFRFGQAENHLCETFNDFLLTCLQEGLDVTAAREEREHSGTRRAGR